MVNVEEIQKVNNLALDLLKQGLAHSRDDAVKQAEKILKKDEIEEYNDMRQTIEQVENYKNNDNLERKTTVKLSGEQVQDILEQNTKFLVKTIKDFKEKIYTLEKDLSQLKNKINYHGLPTVNDIVSTKKEQPQIKPEQAPIKINQDTTENHPRSGKFNENDVSIEKFFYMGNG
jgi:hypothetical protein